MLSTFKNDSILNLGELFHSEKYRDFTQYAAATIMRQLGHDEMGDFSKLIKNTVNHHNLTDYTSLSEKTTILTPAIFLINSSWPGGLAKMGHF